MSSVITNFLPIRNGHKVAFAEYGNPAGPSIISFHGGPGSKSKPSHAERFDLSKYRVILFDQRGCGQSTPLGKLEHNTTDDLLADAERIRQHLHIEQWFVAGSSWGSTLALLYAIKYPKQVRGLLLSAVFLGDRDSIAWAMSDEKGVARLMPDLWAKRMEVFARFGISLSNQDAELLQAIDRADDQQCQELVAAVQNWEGNLFSTQAELEYVSADEITPNDIASVRVFLHYEMNHSFIPDNFILDQVKMIEQLPTVIVHGRYDILCPLEKAYQLAQQLKLAELVIATSSGHKLTAEGATILKLAFDRFLIQHT